MQAKPAAAHSGFVAHGLLVLLTTWALLLVAPDLIRLVRPLGSLGFAADNDGLIYDVQGPFPTLAGSPAWRAGLRDGQHIDLQAMRCIRPTSPACIDLLAVVGGMGGPQRIRPGRTISLAVAAPAKPSRIVTMTAAPVPAGWEDKAVLFLDEVVAILVILGAAWLVWTRPGPMTWGFFVYAIWFNSGADYEAYAWLEERPLLLLAQELVQSLVVAAGYVGLLLFALRVPRDRTEPRWRPLQRTLPVIAIILGGLQLASFGAAFGYPTETITRASFITGWAINLAALAILLARRHGQHPQDYQRLRWVIWGCLIGLPAFIFAESLSETSMFQPLLGAPPSDATLGLLYLLNGILVAFVFEAVPPPARDRRRHPAAAGDAVRPAGRPADLLARRADHHAARRSAPSALGLAARWRPHCLRPRQDPRPRRRADTPCAEPWLPSRAPSLGTCRPLAARGPQHDRSRTLPDRDPGRCAESRVRRLVPRR